jgi:5-methyltetrahydrofolate--homocysteine methyltransferase
MRFQACVRGTTTICDGAWGTEFQKLGAALGACTDEWNLTHPEFVEQVARSYVQAGSRVILTNTFRANSISLAPYGLQDRCEEINRAGVRHSLKAAGNSALVFASIGPSGKLLLTKAVTATQLKAAFSQQAKALASEGADAILIETLTDLAEARIAAAAALETGLPVIVSFVFDSGKNRDRTIMGLTPEQVATTMTSDGVHAIGANCGVGIRDFVPVCKRLAAATNRPIWIKPNAGLPEMVEGVANYKTTPAEFAESVPALVEAGATFLGGCCGTTPDFIREIVQLLALKKSQRKTVASEN